MTQTDIETLLDALSVDEQISLLAGQDFWTTVAVERVGIPSVKVSDGPNGARGGGALVGGVSAAAFPVGLALAATWSPALTREIGVDLARETRSKGAHALLAPTVNIHRSTLNGRNFECYSEDPHLTSEIAVAYIEGLQSQGVGATIKHFIGNESEYQRTTMSSDIDARTLREIYLPPFEAAVKRAKAWAVMTSYNRLNGTYVSERADIVRDILKGEWGFDGLVMSDWFGTQSTDAAMSGGLDLEMPGPGRHRGEKLIAAHREGRVSTEAIRDSARRMIRWIDRIGGFARPAGADERAEDLPATRALIRRAGAEAMVLLKNGGALPLAVRPGARLAILGPNVKIAQAMGGGSAQLNPHYLVTPFDGLREALPADARLAYEFGADNRRLAALIRGEIEAEFFEGRAFDGAVVATRRASEGVLMFMGPDLPAPIDNFSCRIRARQRIEDAGDYEFGLISSGPARLYVNGELVIDNSRFRLGDEYFGAACDEVCAVHRFETAGDCEIVVEWWASDKLDRFDLSVVRIGMSLLRGEAAIARAVELARDADAALLFVGLNAEWDGEGKDRPGLALPGRQDELIARVAEVNPKTIVVLQSGCPVLMPWLDRVAAVVQAWYPGQEVGHAIADVLLGKAEPGGRLPQTFPMRREDDPALLNYPGEAGHVRYGEGVFVGYRHAEARKLPPLFPFGHGLSYTRFAAAGFALSTRELAPGERLRASLEVRNIGERAGSTVLQLYVSDRAASVARPPKELRAFEKVALAPGQTRRVEFELDMRALAFFDVARATWVAEAGAFELSVGFSSADIVAREGFELMRTWIEARESHFPDGHTSVEAKRGFP